MQIPPGKLKRLVFLICGITDALIGAGLLLFGFGFVPVGDALEGTNWWFVLLGAVLFVSGLGVAVYNFSRFEE